MEASAKTCINQIPAVFKKIDWKWGQCNLDIGGGRFETATKYIMEHGANNMVFDPYNRSREHNSNVLLKRDYDSATIANVLCVIKDPDERHKALELARDFVKPGGKIYISIYEGDKSGVGKFSSTGTWQENRKLRTYLDEIYAVFKKEFVKIKMNHIEVTNGVEQNPGKLCPSALQLPNS